MPSEEHLYTIALRQCKLIGDIHFHKLVKTFGSAKEAWEKGKKEGVHIEGIGRSKVSDIGNEAHLKFAEKELEFCLKNDIQLLIRHLDQLPYLLGHCVDAPAILYCRGKIPPQKKQISIVGTRKMTKYGKSFIHEFLESISNSSSVTISGLALGADAEAHRQSIHNNIPTVAVLAHGLQTLYPSIHRKLANEIIDSGGALISEFNSSKKPDREHFIQRNRIIAGMSPTTIIVESAYGGGSMSTVNFANDYNRDVYALPGKINDIQSQGCNLLIAKNKASCIHSVANLVDILNLNDNNKEQIGSLFAETKDISTLSEQQLSIYKCIEREKTTNIDTISEKTNLAFNEILNILLHLELNGFIESLSGKQYRIS